MQEKYRKYWYISRMGLTGGKGPPPPAKKFGRSAKFPGCHFPGNSAGHPGNFPGNPRNFSASPAAFPVEFLGEFHGWNFTGVPHGDQISRRAPVKSPGEFPLGPNFAKVHLPGNYPWAGGPQYPANSGNDDSHRLPAMAAVWLPPPTDLRQGP